MTSCHGVPFTRELGRERRRPPAAPGNACGSRALTFVARLPGQAHAGGADPGATAPTTEMRAAFIRETARLLRLRTSASPATTSSSTAPSAGTPSTWAAAPCTAAPAARSASSPSGHSTAAGLPAVRRRRPQDRRDRVEDTPARATARCRDPRDPRAAAQSAPAAAGARTRLRWRRGLCAAGHWSGRYARSKQGRFVKVPLLGSQVARLAGSAPAGGCSAS
jgi:hypothetical protein